MKLRDILLTGMDIPNETRKLLSRFTVTNGMTKSELKAYEMGVENTIGVMQSLINLDQIVFHLEGNDCIEEFDLDDLIEIIEEKEGDQYGE
jgi:hypothetical protein